MARDRARDVEALNALQDRIGARHAGRLQEAIEAAMREVAEGLPVGGRPDLPLDHMRRIEAAMRDLYREITQQTAESMAARFKSGFSWIETKADESGFYARLYEEYLQRYGGQRIAQISETTRQQILKLIEQGLKQGLSVDEISEEILKAAPVIAETRAVIIARTETHSASMYASLQSAKRSTVPLAKEWVSVEDGRVRDFGESDGVVDEFSHRAMNGKTVPLDEPFEVPNRFGVSERLMYPGDPAGSAANVINCRCGQTYTSADAIEEDAEPSAPPTPVGSERDRLLDKIRGNQAVFSANSDDAFIDAPEKALRAIFEVGDLPSMIHDKSGAYAEGGRISMGAHTPGAESYRRVFRHEYGHVLDDAIAQRRGERFGLFGSFRAVEDLVEDGAELMNARSGFFMVDSYTPKNRAIVEAAEERTNEASRRIFAAARDGDYSDDAKEILRREIPGVEPEAVLALYGRPSMSGLEAAKLSAAWQERDVNQLLARLPSELSGQRVGHSNPFAGLQDTFEASNGAAARIHFGHGKNYYSRNNKAMDVRDLSTRIGRRKFHGFHTGQAFANWFEAYGDKNPATYALYRNLFPRTSAAFEEMLEEFING